MVASRQGIRRPSRQMSRVGPELVDIVRSFRRVSGRGARAPARGGWSSGWFYRSPPSARQRAWNSTPPRVPSSARPRKFLGVAAPSCDHGANFPRGVEDGEQRAGGGGGGLRDGGDGGARPADGADADRRRPSRSRAGAP